MYKALFCDDEKPQREGVQRHVHWSEYGFEAPVLCSNGWEALEVLEKEHIDLLMTDICMPGMDGLEMLERAHTTQPGLYIVILSGYAEFDFAKRAMAEGAREYLLKPLKPSDVHRVLSDFIAFKTTAVTQTKTELVQRVEELLRAHTTDGVSVEAVSEQLHMNTSSLCTRFKKEAGETIAERLAGMQRDQACKLLATSDLSIGEIAEQTGDRNASNFAQWFKKLMGISPSEYRNMIHQGGNRR